MKYDFPFTRKRMACIYLDGASCPPPPQWTPVKNVTKRWFSKRGLKVVQFDCCQARAQFGWLLTSVTCVFGMLKAIRL